MTWRVENFGRLRSDLTATTLTFRLGRTLLAAVNHWVVAMVRSD